MTIHLLSMASVLTYNVLSTNCRYIFSEIYNSQNVLTEKERYLQLERMQLIPQVLVDIMPEVLRHYANLYDINLIIHKATSQATIIDIRYYAKSSLESEYRQLVVANAPMLHSKVPMPYWVEENILRFDINWKIHAPVSWVKRQWLTQNWHLLTYLHRRTR